MMELRSRFAWSSDSSSTASVDRMRSIELEAAEALADLAHLAMRDTGDSGGGGGSKWGSKKKRAKKRVKSESPADDSVSNPVVDSVPSCSDLAEDRTIVDQQHDEPLCSNVVRNLEKAELEADLPTSSPTINHPSYVGGRSRQNLTEAEKEERRLRRILANRESARQTIRRRQALCEELTRKAADLSWENENLKREKEFALKEYQALETTNKHLKEQMAKVIKKEVEESPGDLNSNRVELTSVPPNHPLFLYNQHPFLPFCWPSIMQSSNPVQSHHGHKNAIFIPSNLPMQVDAKLDPPQQQQENPTNGNGPRAPLYMVSYPWLFPVPNHGNGFHPHPSSGLKHTSDETSVNNECSALMENLHSSLPVKVKSEVTSSTEVRLINDLNEMPVGFSPDGDGQCAESHPQKMVLTSLALNSVTPTIAVKKETGITDGIFAKASRLISALPEKKSVDVAAAAEARKRRKELTKLKNLHGRQCRVKNC